MKNIHLNMQKIRRGKGQSSLNRLAYITGEKIKDERLNRSYNYGHEDRIMTTGLLLPSGAEQNFKTAERIFNEAERFEKQKDACTARSYIVAIPRGLTDEQEKELCEKFIQKTFTSNGYPAEYAIHHDPEDVNPHVHILVTNRPMKNGKFIEAKSHKVYDLDADGNRIPILDEHGQQKVDKSRHRQWKSHKESYNPIETKEFLLETRKVWADTCNEILPEELSVTEKSYKDLGIDQTPTIHEGYDQRKKITNEEIRLSNIRKVRQKILDVWNMAKKKAEELNDAIFKRYSNATSGNNRKASARVGSSYETGLDASTREAITQLSAETKRRADEAERRRQTENYRAKYMAEQARERTRQERERAKRDKRETRERSISM